MVGCVWYSRYIKKRGYYNMPSKRIITTFLAVFYALFAVFAIACLMVHAWFAVFATIGAMTLLGVFHATLFDLCDLIASKLN